MNDAPHIVFAGGGTAGHLFPGLAVAEAMRSALLPWTFTFAGGGKPAERMAVRRAGFEYLTLPCHRLPRRPRSVPRFLWSNLAGFRRAQSFLRKNRVAAVVGLGGFASAPMARAAVGCRVPLILLEQNAFPGRVTRWLARSADLVCTALKESLPHLPTQCNAVVTGNPVRRGITQLAATSAKSTLAAKPLLLVLGGSGGSQWLNQQVPASLATLKPLAAPWRIIHQSGSHDVRATRTRYQSLSLEAHITPFIDDMADALSHADLVVCRAGGTTLAELAAAAVPAIAVPFPLAADDHQRHNAAAYQDMGTCHMVQQPQMAGRESCQLTCQLERLLGGEESRTALSIAARKTSHPHAADTVARRIGQLATVLKMEPPTPKETKEASPCHPSPAPRP